MSSKENKTEENKTEENKTEEKQSEQKQEGATEPRPQKKRFWNLFAGKPKPTEAEHKQMRLEALRHDLFHKPVGNSQSEYALNTLLNMLRVETDIARLEVACALSDSPPPTDKTKATAFAVRLCHHLDATPLDPLVIPTLGKTTSTVGYAWIAEIVLNILTETLTALKPLLSTRRSSSQASFQSSSQLLPVDVNNEWLYRETDTCRDALRLGTRLRSPRLVESAMRMLRLLTPDVVRLPGVIGQQTTELRSHAARLLAAVPPDDLYPFWVVLGGASAEARRDLLPVLDDLIDARAIPYLSRLLERHTQWTDGNLVGWAVVRSLQRIGDRRALPVLRRLVAEASIPPGATAYSAHAVRTSPELVGAARHAIEAIEYQRSSSDRHLLLRPSQSQNHELLRPLSETPPSFRNTDQAELLRTETEAETPEDNNPMP